MLLTQEQTEQRLNSPNNLANKFNVEHKRVGLTGRVSTPIPTFMRSTAAILARTKADSQSNIAALTGTTQANVSYINRGVGEVNKNLPEADKVVEQVKEIALDRLVKSLTGITDEKLKDSSAKDLSTIAGNVSKVVHNVSSRESNGDNKTQVNVIVYAPELRDEKKYQTIEV